MDRGTRAIVSHRLPNAEELNAGCGDWLECCQAYIHTENCKARATTPPETPSAAAMRAAEELQRENLLLADATLEELSEVAAIITRHLAGETSEPHCWHCGTILEAVELKLRCDQCPADCDDETCSAFGCAPNGGVSTAPVPAAGDDEDER